jgi:hypothetical protein
MRKSAILMALALVSILLLGACSNRLKEGGPFDPVQISPFGEGATFTVIEEPVLIQGINMARVVVRRETDHSVYAAFVIPPREIPKGSHVTISYVECHRDNMGAINDFLMVNP